MYYLYLIILLVSFTKAEEALGCGGFIISHVDIDYTKISVELYAKDGGIWKDKTECAPSSGYYFIPIYDYGDYILKLVPPAGWSLTPRMVHVSVNGVNDLCTRGEDINFIFEGFGITGMVESYGTTGLGPEGITVELKSKTGVRKTTTKENGTFFFTPVYPGQYTLTISHKLWKIFKKSVTVNVNEGNTELAAGSLVISGYDVTGYVKSGGQPVDGIDLVLFQDLDHPYPAHVDGCNKKIIKDLQDEGHQLCHISSSIRGNFTFDVVSPGHYFIMPYYEGHHTHFQPELIEFEVAHGSVLLPEIFKIVGFSVFGFVRTSRNGKLLPGAQIYLNGNRVANTKEDGSYLLENIKPDSYTISVAADNMQFEAITMKVNHNTLQIPDFIPTLYKVCGLVLSELSHNILITRSESTRTFITKSELPSGKFCVNLNRGKYGLRIILNDDEKSQGIQFFPAMHEFEVTDGPVLGLTFSQIKATVVGKVICNNKEDCIGMKVILKLVTNEVKQENINIVALLDNGTYIFENIKQGNYDVSVAPSKICWKKPSHLITVSSLNEMVAPFIQSGYSVVFVSSHTSMVVYNINEGEKSVSIRKGRTSVCLEKPGVYEFTLKSCHMYQENVISHNTGSKKYEIQLTPIKHAVIVEIECAENYGELYMMIEMNGHKRQEGPLEFSEGRYFIRLILSPSDSAILIPHSEVLFVYPPIISIDGQDDCRNLGPKFSAKKGRVFVGYVSPPLAGVLITIETDNLDILTNETDADGRYRFLPQDNSKQYKMQASKNSYVLVGPDEHGNFIAHKLSGIAVSAVYADNNKPLQGVLLSLSGGQGYRKNIHTGESGMVTFHSLTPGEYFLKPMKKEYSFDPSTKLIDAEEGVTTPILLKGRRFAYSGYGRVTSLNGEPEERVTLLASGVGNCSRLFEEGITEPNGRFHIRGLHPYCNYIVKVKQTAEDKRIEHGVPSAVNISVLENDVAGIKFTVFKTALNTDVLVRIYCKNSDVYRALRLRLSRESNPAGLIHTIRLENAKLTKNNNGVLVYLPALPLDDRSYYIQVESSVSFDEDFNGNMHYFTTNTTFKYIDVDCHSQKDGLRQNMKQTSLWTLVIIFIPFFVFYNIDYIIQLVKDKLNKFNIGPHTFRFRPLPNPPEFVIDKNEIDQIVESINPSKRKLKPRKT